MQVGEFLKGRRPEGLADDLQLLDVGRHEDGDAVVVVGGEVAIDLGTRHAGVVAEAVQGTLPGDQVHQRGEGQRRDDHEVADCFRCEAEVEVGVVDEFPDHRRDHVHRPGEEGDDDGDAAHGDLHHRRTGVDDRERFRLTFGAPLAATDIRLSGRCGGFCAGTHEVASIVEFPSAGPGDGGGGTPVPVRTVA